MELRPGRREQSLQVDPRRDVGKCSRNVHVVLAGKPDRHCRLQDADLVGRRLPICPVGLSVDREAADHERVAARQGRRPVDSAAAATARSGHGPPEHALLGKDAEEGQQGIVLAEHGVVPVMEIVDRLQARAPALSYEVRRQHASHPGDRIDAREAESGNAHDEVLRQSDDANEFEAQKAVPIASRRNEDSVGDKLVPSRRI